MKGTQPTRVRLGAFELDLKAGELHLADAGEDVGNGRILLSEQPFRLLVLLVEREGQIVTREEIKKEFWPNDTIVEFDHSIDVAINKLRRALRDSADEPTYIETIPRRGYRLLVPVEWVGTGQVDNSSGDSSAVQPIAASLIGKKVSHYRVLSVIGGGGMGLVYEAEDLKLGRRVALKFLPEELGGDDVALQRFEREARTASSLDHPNICTIYEVEEHEEQPFIVMQLLEGETLRDCLARAAEAGKAIPLAQLLDIATQVSAGLEAAHRKGIIHRDIKPANIFLTAQGQVKILDFGLAKLVAHEAAFENAHPSKGSLGGAPALDSTSANGFVSGHGFSRAAPTPPSDSSGLQPATPHDATLTRTGAAMGTAGYMSPEQVRSEKLDARTDLFSFGLVLYEMATGQRPFTGETAAVVHDAILNQSPVPVRERNSTIPARLEGIINRAIVKDRELRYQSAAEMRADLQSFTADQSKQSENGKARVGSRWKWATATAVVCVATIAGGLYWHSRKPAKLTERDAIVIADFANSTGDPVFDDTLKQALSIQLEQSPYLNVLSDRKVGATLRLMNRLGSERLTEDVAREVCLRTGSKAMLTGSIAELGSEYVLGLKAVNCDTGDVVAQAQGQAAGKEGVLRALDAAAVSLRSKLGESHSSVQKFDTPLWEATTPSLEALKAYSLGRKIELAKGVTAALPFYKRAVELDPNFAMAYRALSISYRNLNEVGRAEENARRAYQLRDKVSERERLAVEANYYENVTGELEKAAQTYELWQQNYPRDVAAYANLGGTYGRLGNLEKFLEETREAIRLAPNNGSLYFNLGAAYENLNRLDEAEAAYKQAEERKLAGEFLLQARYLLAFLEGDTAQMVQLAAAAMGKPGTEDLLLASQADSEAWHGKLKDARKLTQQAVDSAQRNDAKETAANYQAAAALREVVTGNRQQAHADAAVALKLAQSRDVKAMAALALAQAGDTTTAEKLADELDKAFPLGTLMQRYWLPTIRAAVALERKDPNHAVEVLNGMGSIEVGLVNTGVTVFLCPVYLRGEAYLTLHDGKAAAAEFQKFIVHYGLLGNFPWGALARLGLARAYALDAAADPAAREKARAAYQNFLSLWKDADPDIPVLKQAKAEYAKLQ